MKSISILFVFLFVGCGSSPESATPSSLPEQITESAVPVATPPAAVEEAAAMQGLSEATAYVDAIREGAIVVVVHESLLALEDGEVNEGESLDSEWHVEEPRRVASEELRAALPATIWNETEMETLGEDEDSRLMAGREEGLRRGFAAIEAAYPNAMDLRANSFVTNIAGIGIHSAGACTFLSPHGGEDVPFAERQASDLYLIVCATNDRIA